MNYGFFPASLKKVVQKVIVKNTFNLNYCVLGPVMRSVLKAFFVDQVNCLLNIGVFFVKAL